ncbi:sulfatase-like hydrolase/transferase [Aurantibacter crassamenti]|uniref:sulfatase-like hydrolase/transferase n=1 Tax=Aurantibacter crassamenti TaxID=1837375 RepID=UPI00193A6BA2|nr:sulfatase-like hydrolase/transferase [Aurantibacter crassamenti]MBM1107093.1 sulfatase-like hydrolase/transferase [Aurantibacter crassamenti]
MNTSNIPRYNLKQFTRVIIAFFASLVILSAFQYTILYFKDVIDTIFTVSFLQAIVHHMGYSALVALILVPIFNFFENWRPQVGFRIVSGILLSLLIIETILISYYCTTFVPLGADLLEYSFVAIKESIAGSGYIIFFILISILLIGSLFHGIYRITKKVYHHIGKMYPFTIILFTMFIATLFIDGKPINENKTQFLVLNLYNSNLEANEYVADVAYPLIKKPNTTDVLGEYFNLKDEKPNIVFVIVEGLGRGFVGENATYQGFTPFLDSLATQSLYWENCLSTTGESFGVVPSLLGSLPFGKNGFMELENIPNKLTLFSILKNNGYQTSHYQGTNSALNNLDKFLLSEDVDFVLDRSGFEDTYELQAEDAAGNTKGYPDKELYKKSMQIDRSSNKPKMEVYSTMTASEPYIAPKKEYYINEVQKTLKTGRYESDQVQVIEKNKNIFATILYSDSALEWLFKSYKNQPNYDNTIFIVTANRCITGLPQKNALSPFHVPLMIYSPMLTSTKKMSSISSHFDVTPSLLALLDNHYTFKMPTQVAWLGETLDTETDFRSTKNIPLMRNKNQLKEFVSNSQLLSGGTLYTIDENMNLSTSQNSSAKIKKQLDNFKAMNLYVTSENKILPDSLTIFTDLKEHFEDTDMVWLNSVYNGKNSDKGYLTARKLAFNEEYDRALLLCRYILSEVPSQIDTRILTGRINAWNGNYDEAIEILKGCAKTNPKYTDVYSALLDVCFWSGNNKVSKETLELIKLNKVDTAELKSKIERAQKNPVKKIAQAIITQSIKNNKTDQVSTNYEDE